MTDGRHFEFAAVPLPDGNCLFTMIDVTNSTRIEAALRERATGLEEADRVKTDFVANMSYELRTPLTSIGGFAEMLSAGYAGALAPAAADYVGAILESVARLSKLIDDVLDLTQGDTSGVVLERERIDLGGLCRSVGESQLGRVADKKQTLEIVIDPVRRHRPRRCPPPARIGRASCMRNAVAYTDEGGQIMLRATGDDDARDDHRARQWPRHHARGPGDGVRPLPPRDRQRRTATPRSASACRSPASSSRRMAARSNWSRTVGEGTAVTLTIPRAPA